MEEASLREIAKYKLLLKTRVIHKKKKRKKNKILDLYWRFGMSEFVNKNWFQIFQQHLLDHLLCKGVQINSAVH